MGSQLCRADLERAVSRRRAVGALSDVFRIAQVRVVWPSRACLSQRFKEAVASVVLLEVREGRSPRELLRRAREGTKASIAEPAVISKGSSKGK